MSTETAFAISSLPFEVTEFIRMRRFASSMKRIKQRNLEMDNDEYLKLKGAIEKLRTKGGQDSLVVTNKAAYIVDVAEGKVVTAMDKDDMAENVFTKIDSTLFVN